MGIFSRGEGQEEEQDGSDGIAAPVVTEPAVDDENDGWEDPEPSHAATESPEESPTSEEAGDDDERRPRGWLEADVERLLKAIASGEVAVEGDAPLTPHYVAAALTKWEGLAKEPSTGAVSAVFDRWVKIGAAVMETKPYRFIDFTDAAKTQGIPAMKQYLKDQKKLDKQTAKDAETEAAKAAAVEAANQAEPAAAE